MALQKHKSTTINYKSRPIRHCIANASLALPDASAKLGGMEPLSADEARVLGVLIEKQMTTPDQYPLTLNSIVAGASQKNNRFPVREMSDDQAFDAAEALRASGLAVRVEQSGARVGKYKHMAAEKLECRPAELALLAELLLRGPQTVGELRGRASRMQPFESTEAVSGFLRTLMDRPEPLVRRLPPAPGTRAEKFEELLSGAEAGDGSDSDAAEEIESSSAPVTREIATTGLVDRVAALEAQVELLQDALRRLAAAVGEKDPLL